MFEKFAEQFEQDVTLRCQEKLAAIYQQISNPKIEQQLLNGPGLLGRLGQKVKGFFGGNKKPGYFTTMENAISNQAYTSAQKPSMGVRPAFDSDTVRGATDMFGETNWAKLRNRAKDQQKVYKQSLSDKKYKGWASGQDKIIENSREANPYAPAVDPRLNPEVPLSNQAQNSIQNYFNPPIDF